MPPSALSADLEFKRNITKAGECYLDVPAQESSFDRIVVLEDIPTVLSRTFHLALADLAAQRNALHAIQKLPFEVLAHVFFWLQPKERIPSTLACKKWNHVLNTSPNIWTIIWGSSRVATSSRALTKQLALSAECLISLSVTITESNYQDICAAVQAAMHRVEVLCVYLHAPTALRAAIDNAGNMLSTPAPRLTKFWVNDHYDVLYTYGDYGVVCDDWVVFGGQAPHLNLVGLQGDFDLTRLSHGAFRAVQHLFLNVNEDAYPNVFVSMLDLLPSLQNLVLKVFAWNSFIPSSFRLPPTLTSLDIDSAEPACGAVVCLASLQWSHLRSVSFRQIDEFEDLDLMFRYFTSRTDDFTAHSCAESAESPRTLRTGWIDWEFDFTEPETGANIHFYEDDDEMHGIIPVWHPGRAPSRMVWERAILDVAGRIDPRLLANITRLYINELILDPETMEFQLPPLPSVQHLTVWLIPSHFHKNGLGTSPFLLHQLDGELGAARVLSCPQLETLTIAAGHEEWTEALLPRLTVQMVLEFVSVHLSYESRQLQSMKFIGVRLIVGEPDEFERLLRLAQTTDWDERFLDWAANTEHHSAFMIP